MATVGADAAQERAALKRVSLYIDFIVSLPLITAAALTKKSVGSFLTSTTGLSRSHMSGDKIANLRPSTLERMRKRSTEFGRVLALKGGWSEQHIDDSIATAPRLHSGGPAPLAQFLHFSQNREIAPLPLAIAYALEIDELIDALTDLVKADDSAGFRDAILEFLACEMVLDESVDAVRQIEEWRSRATWSLIDAPFKEAIDSLILHFYAAVDAEWGGRYCQAFEPRPVFLWIAPRLSPDLDMTKPAKGMRNLVHRPVRRFLELGYAFAERVYLGKWPSAAPGRTAIGSALVMSDTDVGNFFDGTRKMGFDEVQEFWATMCWQPKFQTKRKGQLAFPSLLASTAIAWQLLMVQTGKGSKFKSALCPRRRRVPKALAMASRSVGQRARHRRQGMAGLAPCAVSFASVVRAAEPLVNLWVCSCRSPSERPAPRRAFGC